MSDEIRVNRPQQQAQSQQPMRGEYQNQSMMNEPAPSRKSSKMPWIILGVIVVILVVLGIVFRGKLFPGSAGTIAGANQDSGYQAVFLTNGQVYFGKMSNANGDYVTLTDIFYLQVVQPPLQGQQQGTTAQQPQQQISLVKLGNELHGPVDLMHISRSQILFYEDLKTSGQVVQAIQAYKANPSGTAAAPAAQQQAPAATAPATQQQAPLTAPTH